ncbi:MAG TPA: tol-pal system protein YbgF [Xanthobacteraceae bacterium]|nr:tol-pal system protein YbgF [Xanthobacteraceae bacterium]
MTHARRFRLSRPRLSRSVTALVIVLGLPAAAAAQQWSGAQAEPNRLDSFGRDVTGAIGSLFGQGGSPAPGGAQVAQAEAADLLVRIDQLERQIRQLTGAVEQLQFRNQQLEQQLHRIEDETGRGPAPGVGARAAPARPGAISPPAAAIVPAAPPGAAPGGHRGDAFDPSRNPTAPGAPRPLGSSGSRSDDLARDPSARIASAAPDGGVGSIASEEPPVGAPGGREPGAPLDLTRMSGAGAPPPAQPTRPAAPPPGSRTAALPAAQTPREEFDAAYSYLARKDYALAEQGLRNFLRKYPSDALAGDAQFWLGESMFQRQRYRESADAFVAMAKKFEKHAKAPDALVRLGQSLAALHEKELACATFGEVTRKYPRASAGVKQTVEREQKRARC